MSLTSSEGDGGVLPMSTSPVPGTRSALPPLGRGTARGVTPMSASQLPGTRSVPPLPGRGTAGTCRM